MEDIFHLWSPSVLINLLLPMMTSSNGYIFRVTGPLCGHRSPVNSPHKGQWRGALMFSLICAWINGWVNNREAGDLRSRSALCSVIVRRAGLLWSQQDFEWWWSVPLFKCLTVLEFSFILFDLCLLITFFNFIMNYVPIVTFWIFTYHKIWILSIMFCFIWSYWIIYFLACLGVSWRVVS